MANKGVEIISSVTGDDGETRFERKVLLYESGESSYLATAWQFARTLSFRWTPGEFDFDFHLAPRRRLVIVLEGGLEARVSSGEVRVFRPGDIWEIRDTWGRGHCSKAHDGKPFRTAFVTLDDDVKLDRRMPLEGGSEMAVSYVNASCEHWDGRGSYIPYSHGGVEGLVTEEMSLSRFRFAQSLAAGATWSQFGGRQIEIILLGRFVREFEDGRTCHLSSGNMIVCDPARRSWKDIGCSDAPAFSLLGCFP